MSFRLPDLILESIIRDGFNNARRDPTVLQDVFGDLTLPFADQKYGIPEVDKIIKLIQNKEVSVVHSFNLVPTNLPCISIQLADDRETENRAHLGNYVTQIQKAFTSPEDLAGTVVVSSFTPQSYNPVTGVVTVDNSVNLVEVYANLLFVDSTGAQHQILGGINNTPGSRQFIIEKAGTVSLSPGAQIISSINYAQYLIRGNIEQTQLIVGVHTKDALLTKYLYVLIKYFVLSRRDDLIARGMEINTYTGSDFTRNMDYGADVVYTRFFNVSAMVEHQWRSDKVQLIDSVQVVAQVEKDQLTNEELGITNQSIQQTE